jgi:hypothetical protein
MATCTGGTVSYLSLHSAGVGHCERGPTVRRTGTVGAVVTVSQLVCADSGSARTSTTTRTGPNTR